MKKIPYRFLVLWVVFILLGGGTDLQAQLSKLDEETKLILKANTLCEEKEYRQAIKVYRKALEEFNSADAAYNLGLTYEINIKDPSLAVLYYSKFLSLESKTPDAEVVRIWIQHIKKKENRVILEHQEGVDAPPGLKTTEEKKTVKLILRSGPPINEEDIPSNQLKRAHSFLRTGNDHYIKKKYKEAIEDFMQVLASYDSTFAYYNIGIIYHRKLNEPQKAIPFYRRYLEIDSYTETANEVKKFIEEIETTLLMEKLQKEGKYSGGTVE